MSRSAVSAFLAGLALIAAFTARALEAQAPNSSSFEIRPYVGAYLPTGDQRDLLKDAVFAGAQASYRVIPALAITATLGWSPTEERLGTRQKLDIFQYDLGAELRGAGWVERESWNFTPFVGLGVGGRTYDYRDLDVDAKTNVAGYGALGGEFGFGRLGLRIEGRDYLSRFKPLTGTGDTDTRNDVSVAAGLTIRL